VAPAALSVLISMILLTMPYSDQWSLIRLGYAADT